MMTHVHVKSSSIKSAAYDPETETMEVRFQNGGLYRFAKVTQKVWNLFFTAESKGRYVNEVIKPNCPATKVEEPKRDAKDEPTGESGQLDSD